MKVRDLINSLAYQHDFTSVYVFDSPEVTEFSIYNLKMVNEYYGDRLIIRWYINADYISERIELNICI